MIPVVVLALQVDHTTLSGEAFVFDQPTPPTLAYLAVIVASGSVFSLDWNPVVQ